jgi:hypothetical protein
LLTERSGPDCQRDFENPTRSGYCCGQLADIMRREKGTSIASARNEPTRSGKSIIGLIQLAIDFDPRMVARTNPRRIPIAREWVRVGFSGTIEDNAPFRSLEFLTEELSTTEMQAVLPIVSEWNAFSGAKVAGAIESFRGKVSGWQFDCEGSPLLVAVLPHWTGQIEESTPGSDKGRRISEEEHSTLIESMREVFVNQLGADYFEARDEHGHIYSAWWD